MTQTKEKLLASATKMFAEHGFNGVSTRDLVTISMVNLCSINYYFGSIDNLLKQLNVHKSITSYGGSSLRNQLALTLLDDLREQGYTYQEIADKYKVSRTAINNLHNKLKKTCETI